MAQKKMDPQLMQAGEEAFWKKLEELEKSAEERYIVYDKKSGEIIAQNVRLSKEKLKAEV